MKRFVTNGNTHFKKIVGDVKIQLGWGSNGDGRPQLIRTIFRTRFCLSLAVIAQKEDLFEIIQKNKFSFNLTANKFAVIILRCHYFYNHFS